MRFVDEYRSGDLAQKLAHELSALVEPGREVKIMEVCGGHTHAIYKHGLEDLVPPEVDFVHGPGCPVCVIPMGRVDDGIAVAKRPEVIFTCFGDMLRVPGGDGTLLDAKAEGADVRMVYSPLDALRIARSGGPIVTWLQKAEKLPTACSRARRSVRAVAGAVVSKPIAKKITSRWGFLRATSSASSGE